MALPIQEIPNNRSLNNDKVYITIVSASESTNTPKLLRLNLPIYRTLLINEAICEDLMKTILGKIIEIPQSFLNVQDCDMVHKVSRMLCDSIKLHQSMKIDYFCVFIMVFNDSCWYNVLKCSHFFLCGDEQIPSSEAVRSLACGSGVSSFPSKENAKELLMKDQDQEDGEENQCVICLQGFISEIEVTKLPCSHVYHFDCILRWLRHKDTCPLCRNVVEFRV